MSDQMASDHAEAYAYIQDLALSEETVDISKELVKHSKKVIEAIFTFFQDGNMEMAGDGLNKLCRAYYIAGKQAGRSE